MSVAVFQSFVFVAAAGLTGLILAVARRVQLLDVPVSRSAHEQPTPVGGGFAIVVLFALACWYGVAAGMLSTQQLLVLSGASLVALTGLVDDWLQLDLRWRLPLQCVAALWSLAWLGDMPAIDFGLLTLHSDLLLRVLAALALLWLLNLYNFMDGIDGLAAVELLFVTLLSSLLLINSNAQALTWLTASLFAAGAGFLVWNWPPARIFMGDVGSSFIGFTLGLLALLSMQQGSLSVWTWVILLNVFVVDATLTLLRRFIAGKRWYEGHASHAYQHAARRYGSHRKVTLCVIGINCLWLAPLAWLSVQFPALGFYLAALASLPLLWLANGLGAGREYSAGD